jgi:hypothetical protein
VATHNDGRASFAEIHLRENGHLMLLSQATKKPSLFIVSMAFALAMFVMAGIGAARSYSVIPFWDMWNGTLEFIMRIQNGEYAAWWSQHNEHRIVLSRVLFWLDYKWFGDVGIFLIVVNYLLVGCAATLFWIMVRQENPESASETVGALGFLLVGFLFLWSQYNNLAWAFQSQFFLASLVPLLSFYSMHLAARSRAGSMRYFSLAVAGGVASAGTMANGILVLPLLLTMALAMRASFSRVTVLAITTIVVLTAYFFDYRSVVGHGAPVESIMKHPFKLIVYVLMYAGSPTHFLLGESSYGRYAAMLFGVLFAGLTLGVCYKGMQKRGEANLDLALAFFLLYVLITALGTGTGRIIFGLDQALSSRYTTPALMGWAAIAVSYSPKLIQVTQTRRNSALLVVGSIIAVMINFQLAALKPQRAVLFERQVAALALTLGANDAPQIGHVYPFIEPALNIAKSAASRKLSVFSIFPYSVVREELGSPSKTARSSFACIGTIDTVELLDGGGAVKVVGWIFEPNTAKVPEFVRFIDKDGKISGFAFVGRNRPDVSGAVGPAAMLTGFQGYLSLDSFQGTQSIESSMCTLITESVSSAYSISHANVEASPSTVKLNSVASNSGWLGTDFDRTDFKTMKVVGSYATSDADTGTISLRLKRGDRILYRSGPTGGRQLIGIPSLGISNSKLPTSTRWVQLEFSNPSLPVGEFDVTLTDSGPGWGEWSAIAVLKD